MNVRLIIGDCRQVMAAEGPFDLIMADPPYEDTSLAWDRRVHGWLEIAHARLKPTGSLWLFGSMRSFIGSATAIARARFRVAQDIVWEKPNGTGFAADRFKRVHEHAVQLYRADAPWAGVYNEVQRVRQGSGRKSARVSRPDRVAHGGTIGPRDYVDDGWRIVRSVIPAPSVRGGGASHGEAGPTPRAPSPYQLPARRLGRRLLCRVRFCRRGVRHGR